MVVGEVVVLNSVRLWMPLDSQASEEDGFLVEWVSYAGADMLIVWGVDESRWFNEGRIDGDWSWGSSDDC